MTGKALFVRGARDSWLEMKGVVGGAEMALAVDVFLCPWRRDTLFAASRRYRNEWNECCSDQPDDREPYIHFFSAGGIGAVCHPRRS